MSIKLDDLIHNVIVISVLVHDNIEL